jgi:outer membrane immunogenic protein
MRGHRSKYTLLCGVAAGALTSVLGTTGVAQAQHNWTGFYVGAYAGGARGQSNVNGSTTCPALGWTGAFSGGYYCSVTVPPDTSGNAAAVAGAATGSMNAGTFVGGAQAGFNWQANRVVYGVEADFGYFGLNASRQASGTYPQNPFNLTVPPFVGKTFTVGSSLSTDWLFTARARVGWTVDNWLLFVTGGLAAANIETTLSFSDNNATGGFAGAFGAGGNVRTKLGWTLGGGAEFALDKHWTVKGEYLYLDFGSIDTSALVMHPASHSYSNLLGTSTDLKAHVVRAGINYSF